jgi:hypothetical protein
MTTPVIGTVQTFTGAFHTLAETVDVGSGPNRALIVAIAAVSGSGPSFPLVTCNYNTVPMMVTTAQDFASAWFAGFAYLSNPDTGSNTLQILFNAGAGLQPAYWAVVIPLTSAGQTTASLVRTVAGTTSTGDPISTAISALADSLVVDLSLCTFSGAPAITPGAGQTQIDQIDDFGASTVGGAASSKTGASAMSWTGNPNFWAQQVIEVVGSTGTDIATGIGTSR